MSKYLFLFLAVFFSLGAHAQFSQFMTEYKPAELSALRPSSVPRYTPSYDSGEYSQYFTRYSTPVLRSKRTLSLETYDLLHDRVCQSQVIEYAYSDGSVEYTCTHIQQPNGQWVYNGKLDSLSDLCYRMRNSPARTKASSTTTRNCKSTSLTIGRAMAQCTFGEPYIHSQHAPSRLSPARRGRGKGFKFKCHRFV